MLHFTLKIIIHFFFLPKENKVNVDDFRIFYSVSAEEIMGKRKKKCVYLLDRQVKVYAVRVTPKPADREAIRPTILTIVLAG